MVRQRARHRTLAVQEQKEPSPLAIPTSTRGKRQLAPWRPTQDRLMGTKTQVSCMTCVFPLALAVVGAGEADAPGC